MEIKDLVKLYGLTKDDFWELSSRPGTHILSHDACEKIAQKERIIFDVPQVVMYGNMLGLIGTARKEKDRTIWSTGEASPENVKMSGKYYLAMAEKRLKDRLTLKWIDAAQYGIYSETEAEGFKQQEQPGEILEMPDPIEDNRSDEEKIEEKFKLLMGARVAKSGNHNRIKDIDKFLDGLNRTTKISNSRMVEMVTALTRKKEELSGTTA